VLKNRYVAHHLVQHSILSWEGSSMPGNLQEFAAAIDHLAHLAYVDSIKHHISREAARGICRW
jgi:hypothetical protein